MLFLLKLALVAATILGATAAARRWGHSASGLLAGLPMIIGPITAVLLIDQGAERVRPILLATLQSQPAIMVHALVFAYAARRLRAPACLLLANGAFLAAALALTQLALPATSALALAAVAWGLATLALPRSALPPGTRVPVPPTELYWRVAVALAVAAGVIVAAGTLPPIVGGVLLAAPIAGNVLPAFTLPRHGADATALLMRGFVRGQLGFASFVATCVLLLPHVSAGLAWALAVAAAMLAPWVQGQLRR